MYSAEINRSRPACLLLLIDQSFSMSEPWAGTDSSKAQELAKAVNRLLGNAVLLCSKGDGRIHDYFEVGVIGYGAEVKPVLHGSDAGRPLLPIGEVGNNPRRVDTVEAKVPDGAGGLVPVQRSLPVWIDPEHNGKTPMVQAFRAAGDTVVAWCSEHRNSFPPIVINITDGVSTDGDPADAARALCAAGTDDGPALLFNLHLSANPAQPSMLPSTSAGVPDENAARLFNISSELPSGMLEAASVNFAVQAGARGFTYNADATMVISFLDIGTRAVTPTGLKELTSGESSN